MHHALDIKQVAMADGLSKLHKLFKLMHPLVPEHTDTISHSPAKLASARIVTSAICIVIDAYIRTY